MLLHGPHNAAAVAAAALGSSSCASLVQGQSSKERNFIAWARRKQGIIIKKEKNCKKLEIQQIMHTIVVENIYEYQNSEKKPEE